MTVAQIISFLTLVFIVSISILRKGDPFSPAKVFLVIWSSAILLVEFKFSGYQHTWPAYSWFVLVTGLISFLLGCYISYSLCAHYRLKSLREIRTKIVKEIDANKLYNITIVLFIVYLAGFCVEVLIEGYIPLFSPRPDRARIEFGVFAIHLLVNLQLTLSVICFEYIIFSRNKGKKIIVWSVFIVSFLTFGTLLQRFSFFITALIIFLIVFYTSKKITFKKVVIVSLIFLVMLWLIQSVRVAQYVQQFVYQISKMRYSEKYALFTEPYMYITMNLENMARGAELLENHTFGLMTFDWLSALGGFKHWSQEYFNLNPRPFLVSDYNTFPFLWDYFYDFGLLGIFLCPLLLGLFISLSYYQMKKDGNLRWVVYYSLGFSIMVISFFTNALSMLSFVSNVGMLFFIHSILLQKKEVQNSNA